MRADVPGEIHYPDLRTLPPSDLRIESVGKQKLLHFTNIIANLGRGPLELISRHNHANATTEAYQNLFTHDVGGNWSLAGVQFVGAFAFHHDHDHWHFEDFARYELRHIAADGSPGGAVVSIAPKVSYCLADFILADGTLTHAQPRTYVACGVDLPQGISVGWADVYTWDLAGQSLDITGVPNGAYWLLSTADPNDRLNEGGAEFNNTGAVKVQIKGRKVTILNDSAPSPQKQHHTASEKRNPSP